MEVVKSISPDTDDAEDEMDQVALETKEDQHPAIIIPHGPPPSSQPGLFIFLFFCVYSTYTQSFESLVLQSWA